MCLCPLPLKSVTAASQRARLALEVIESESFVAAGPVSRILSALRQDGHSSGPRITAGLKRPTRRLWRAEPARTRPKPDSLPIWSCSVWGLPCPPHYCGGGALLPHLFTLTPLPRRDVFCGTSRQPGLNPASRTLSGTLLCGVRTFLPRRRSAESDRPVQLPTESLYAIAAAQLRTENRKLATGFQG